MDAAVFLALSEGSLDMEDYSDDSDYSDFSHSRGGVSGLMRARQKEEYPMC